VVSLQDILSDKQARGAWGQDRMEDIVRDQLPPDLYQFQGRLSNNSEPDCVIRIPGMAAAIVIDAKFPLEAFEAMKAAANDGERKLALAQMKADVQKHVSDIARKYLIPGEVQSPALMFVPSESIYAELHTTFPEIMQRARRAQVVIVSPHILWLAVNTIRTLMRDAKMREQASHIQKEVGELLLDVKRLAERVGDLRKHFETTNRDIGQIEISAKRIVTRGEKIEAVELTAPEAEKSKLAGPA
jgi:DNA recombination protein RmuC